MPGPQLLPEEEFEDAYTTKFEAMVQGHGLLVDFRRDRAALDIGVMLKELGTVRLSGTKVWFQLKRVHKQTLSEEALVQADHVAVSVRLDHLRFWYAMPDATYLVVFLDATNTFLAEDVRDIVDRHWGVSFLLPERFDDQETITVVERRVMKPPSAA